MRKAKRIIGCKKIVLGALAFLTMTGCGGREDVVEKKDVVVEISNPQQGDLAISGSFMGTVSPQEEVYVIPFVNGEVEKIHVKVGDYVMEGDVLGQIDDTPAQLQLDSANASLNTVQANKKASTGGASTLQNMQTEGNIATIKDNITTLGANRDKLVDTQSEIKRQMDQLEDAKNSAQLAYNNAQTNLAAAQRLALDPTDKEAKRTLENAGIEISATNPIQVVLPTLQATVEGTGQAYQSVEANYAQSYPALERQYNELKSSIDEVDRNGGSLDRNLKLAQDSYDLSKGQVSKETAAVYDAQIRAAQVGVESALYQQDLYTLKAPISGVVESVQVEENGIASTGSPAFIISNKESMKVTFKVSEEIQKTLAVGDKIEVEGSDKTFDATISQIGQMVDLQSGLFLVEAVIKAASDELLTGTSVKLHVPTYKVKDALLIPYDAIFYDDRQAYVYVVENDKAVRKDVEVALFDDENAAISAGLSAEDRVITTYSSALSDQAGVAVKGSSSTQEE